MTQSELQKKICEIQFVCIELNLYIDTHPDDGNALADYRYYSKMLQSLTAAYENEYGSLLGFGHSKTAEGSWVYSEWPWE